MTGLCFCIFPIATTNDVSTLLDALNDLNKQEGTSEDLGKRVQNIETMLHQHHPGDILQNGSTLLPNECTRRSIGYILMHLHQRLVEGRNAGRWKSDSHNGRK